MDLARTPPPPYYAVIFTSLAGNDLTGYEQTAERMLALAQSQPGFLGFESAREAIGVTVSYWQDLASIRAWKRQVEHVEAQRRGQEQWYRAYTTRICRVESEYSFAAEV